MTAGERRRGIAGGMKSCREDALYDSAILIARDAAGRAPVDTGNLRGSIRAERSDGGARVSASCEYAAAVELGSARSPAQPFLRPAAQDAASGILQSCRDSYKKMTA